MGLIKDINSILEYGEKTTAYKYALLESIFDYVIEFPSEPPKNNFHFIPIIYLAKQFLTYYYPFYFTGFYIHNPGGGGNRPAIISSIEKHFIGRIQELKRKQVRYISKIEAKKEEGIVYINRWYEFPSEMATYFITLLK